MGKKPRKKTKTKPVNPHAKTQTPASPSAPLAVMSTRSATRQDEPAAVPPALARRTAPAATAGAAVGAVAAPNRPRPNTSPVLTDAPAGDAAKTPAANPQKAGAQAVGGGCSAVFSEAEPQGLAATYWLDAEASETPYTMAVRFTGARIDVVGKPGAHDRFERVERIDRIPSESGRIAITTRVKGINQGSWRVTATPVKQVGEGTAAPTASKAHRLSRHVETITTRLAPLTHGPGVRLPAWPALVGLGVVVAIALQAALLARAQLDVAAAVGVSLGASVLGYVAAKAWYLALHRQHPRHFVNAGACIQGFLVGGFGALAVGVAVFGLPVGTLLDVTAPGLFFGMAIGRPGCFLTGCCAGRPTSSRWGLWSSDRRLAIRRFPVQLVEAVVALLIGIAALALVLSVQPPIGGAIFAGAVTLYTLCRQLLFPLRVESRTARGRMVTMALCGLVLVADLAAFLVA